MGKLPNCYRALRIASNRKVSVCVEPVHTTLQNYVIALPSIKTLIFSIGTLPNMCTQQQLILMQYSKRVWQSLVNDLIMIIW